MMRPLVGSQHRDNHRQRVATRQSPQQALESWPEEGSRVLFQLKGSMAHGTVLKRAGMRVRVTHWVDGALAGMYWVGVEQCAKPADDAYAPPSRAAATPPPGSYPVATPGLPPAAQPGGRVPPPRRASKGRGQYALERAGGSPPETQLRKL